jgi:hypothetical protein
MFTPHHTALPLLLQSFILHFWILYFTFTFYIYILHKFCFILTEDP